MTKAGKHFNVGSTLFLGWYDVGTSHNVTSMLKQRCVQQHWNLQRSTTLKQHCVFQRWIEQRLATSKQGYHFQPPFSQRWATSKQRREYDRLGKKIKPRFKNKIIFLSFKEYAGLKFFFVWSFYPICKRIFAEPQRFLKHRVYWITKSIFKQSHFLKCHLVFNFKRQV